MHYHTIDFSVFFGNKINGLTASGKRISDAQEDACISNLTAALSQQLMSSSLLLPQQQYAPLKSPLVLLQQIHGTTMHSLTTSDHCTKLALRSHEGDGLITTLSQTAIGVLTADCLPIIFYKKSSHTLAIVHAGWRGLVQNIIEKTLQALGNTHHNTKDYHIVLGPSARNCCYHVTAEFLDAIPRSHHVSLEKRDTRWYFDLHAYAQHELTLRNIPASSIHTITTCTICSPTFYSYRREGAQLLQRQVTAALLHSKPTDSI